MEGSASAIRCHRRSLHRCRGRTGDGWECCESVRRPTRNWTGSLRSVERQPPRECPIADWHTHRAMSKRSARFCSKRENAEPLIPRCCKSTACEVRSDREPLSEATLLAQRVGRSLVRVHRHQKLRRHRWAELACLEFVRQSRRSRQVGCRSHHPSRPAVRQSHPSEIAHSHRHKTKH